MELRAVSDGLAGYGQLYLRGGGEGVGYITGPQSGLDQRFDLVGGKLRADAELEPGKARPVVGARGGDGQAGEGGSPLARRPLQREGIARRHGGQQVLGRHRPGPGAACPRRLIHHELEAARLDPAAPAAFPPGHHRVGMRAARVAVGSHGWPGLPYCMSCSYPSWRCWPGRATPLEPPDGLRPGSSVTGPWPCWPGGATPLEPPDGSRPGSSVTGPWPCWPGGATPLEPPDGRSWSW